MVGLAPAGGCGARGSGRGRGVRGVGMGVWGARGRPVVGGFPGGGPGAAETRGEPGGAGPGPPGFRGRAGGRGRGRGQPTRGGPAPATSSHHRVPHRRSRVGLHVRAGAVRNGDRLPPRSARAVPARAAARCCVRGGSVPGGPSGVGRPCPPRSRARSPRGGHGLRPRAAGRADAVGGLHPGTGDPAGAGLPACGSRPAVCGRRPRGRASDGPRRAACTAGRRGVRGRRARPRRAPRRPAGLPQRGDEGPDQGPVQGWVSRASASAGAATPPRPPRGSGRTRRPWPAPPST